MRVFASLQEFADDEPGSQPSGFTFYEPPKDPTSEAMGLIDYSDSSPGNPRKHSKVRFSDESGRPE